MVAEVDGEGEESGEGLSAVNVESSLYAEANEDKAGFF